MTEDADELRSEFGAGKAHRCTVCKAWSGHAQGCPEQEDHVERCEVCETTENLHCCTREGQPMIWFCDEHLREHVEGAHRECFDCGGTLGECQCNEFDDDSLKPPPRE